MTEKEIRLKPDSPSYQKAFAGVGGFFASLWTCENSTKTFNTLVAALTFGKLASKIKVSDIKNRKLENHLISMLEN